MKPRDPIPKPIKRQVRQDCYFGCVICGMPFFEYDHIIPYSEGGNHTAENLVLLCRNHHAAKTNKQLHIDTIKEAKKNPYNMKRIFSGGGYRFEPYRKLGINIGSNTAHKSFPEGMHNHHCIWINGISYFTIHCIEKNITFSLLLTDTDGKAIFVVDHGEIRVSPQVWDYTFVGNNIQIRKGPGEILLDVVLSNYYVEIKKGCFIHESNKDGYIVTPECVTATTNSEHRGWYVACTSINNHIGDFGFVNKKLYPYIDNIGFGFAQTV